jgi:hypothetical protein
MKEKILNWFGIPALLKSLDILQRRVEALEMEADILLKRSEK